MLYKNNNIVEREKVGLAPLSRSPSPNCAMPRPNPSLKSSDMTARKRSRNKFK